MAGFTILIQRQDPDGIHDIAHGAIDANWPWYPAPLYYLYNEEGHQLEWVATGVDAPGDAPPAGTGADDLPWDGYVWSVDDLFRLDMTADQPLADRKLILPVRLPEGCTRLLLRYDNEGDARINLVAMDVATGKPIAPKTGKGVTVTSADPAFPLDKGVFLDADDQPIDTLPLGGFGWVADGSVKPGAPAGTWTVTAGLQNEPLDLIHRNSITGADGRQYWFHHWEYNTLLLTLAAPDEQYDTPQHQDYYLPTANLFGYVILWYSSTAPVGGVTWGGHTIPQPEDHGFAGRIWSVLVHELGLVFSRSRLLKGDVVPTRHAPGTAAHGEAVPPRPLAAVDRVRVRALARLYPNDDGELARLLHELHR